MPSIAVLGRVCPVTGELSVAYTRRHPIKHALTIKVRGTGRVFGWRDRIENIGKVDVLGRVASGDHRPKPWVAPNRAVWGQRQPLPGSAQYPQKSSLGLLRFASATPINLAAGALTDHRLHGSDRDHGEG